MYCRSVNCKNYFQEFDYDKLRTETSFIQALSVRCISAKS